METAGASAQSWWRRCGIALVVAGAALVPLGHGEAAEADRLTLVTPGLGCGPAEGSMGTSLVARVVRETRRGAPPRQAAKPRARARAAAPQPAPAEEEAPALFLHAYYTCLGTAPAAPMPVGMGWLAVGPVRHG